MKQEFLMKLNHDKKNEELKKFRIGKVLQAFILRSSLWSVTHLLQWRLIRCHIQLKALWLFKQFLEQLGHLDLGREKNVKFLCNKPQYALLTGLNENEGSRK